MPEGDQKTDGDKQKGQSKGNEDVKSTKKDVKETLQKKLAKRPSKVEVQEKNILKKGGKLAGAISALEKANLEKKLNQKIDNRPSKDEIEKECGVSEKLAPALQGAANKLEFKLKSDALNRELEGRAKRIADAKKNESLVPAQNVAPALRAVSKKLEREMTKNKLGKLLATRPTPEELVDAGIVNPRISSKVKAVAKKLEHCRRTDKVGHLLERRQDKKELENQGILEKTKIAPALQAASKKLEFNLKRSNFHYSFANRKSIEELSNRGIINPANYSEYFKAMAEEDDDGEDEKDYKYRGLYSLACWVLESAPRRKKYADPTSKDIISLQILPESKPNTLKQRETPSHLLFILLLPLHLSISPSLSLSLYLSIYILPSTRTRTGSCFASRVCASGRAYTEQEMLNSLLAGVACRCC